MVSGKEKVKIMDKSAMQRAVQRIGYEIIERNKGTENIVLIGIQRRGVPLAERIAAHIGKIENTTLRVGRLDITFYRDDLTLLAEHPVVNGTDISFSISQKDVVLVDDVLFTGRTARAALEALMEVGRPRTIQFAVLIDRGHREVPLHADYVGKNVPTSKREQIAVLIAPFDAEEGVVLLKGQEG